VRTDRVARLAARLLAGLLMIGLFAGCASNYQSGGTVSALPAPETTPTTMAKDVLVADDGAKLPLRIWRPRGEVHAVIIGVHGFNDYSTAFEMPADVWAHYGIITYAYDQRGFGANPHPGVWPGAEAMCRDLDAAVRLVRRRHPDLPVYVAGESMGGAVVLVTYGGAECTPTAKPDGLILVSPAVWARSTMPLLNRVALWLGARIIPNQTFTGKGLGVLASDNFPMLRRLSHDPLFIKNTRVDAIYGLVDLMDQALAAVPHDKLPSLVLIGAHDEIVPPEPFRALAATLPDTAGERQRLAYYPDGWHMLLRDIEGPLVAEDVAAWVYDHAVALPTGADKNAGLLLQQAAQPSMTASR
jgi:alpha-beta hydrolase superfamily lysophospholipase